jgi:hypothetical protein
METIVLNKTIYRWHLQENRNTRSRRPSAKHQILSELTLSALLFGNKQSVMLY